MNFIDDEVVRDLTVLCLLYDKPWQTLPAFQVAVYIVNAQTLGELELKKRYFKSQYILPFICGGRRSVARINFCS